jgi:hypothetical protein
MSVGIVPTSSEWTVWLVLDELKSSGPVWREMSQADANEVTVIDWIIEGQFNRPLSVVAFNIEEGWSRDATKEIAFKLLAMSRNGRLLGVVANDFVERVTGETPIAVV